MLVEGENEYPKQWLGTKLKRKHITTYRMVFNYYKIQGNRFTHFIRFDSRLRQATYQKSLKGVNF